MEYVDDLDAALKRYVQEVIPMMDDGNYLQAALELNLTIMDLDSGRKQLPQNRTKAYALGLSAGFKVLKQSLESQDQGLIDRAIDGVNQRLDLVGITVDALVEKYGKETKE